MKDTQAAARLELEDARQQAVYERAMREIEASRRRASGEAVCLVYLATEIGQDSRWNIMGTWALRFLIVMAGVIPNLLMLNVIL